MTSRFRVHRRSAAVLAGLALAAGACSGGGGSATSEAPASTNQPETAVLVVGSDVPHPPFTEFDAAGRVVGFEASLVAEIADRLGLEVRWVDAGPDILLDRLARGDLDVVASSMPIGSSDRVSFTSPYYLPKLALLVNTTLTPRLASWTDLGAADVVGVATATPASEWAPATLRAADVEVREFSLCRDAFNELEGGRITAVIAAEPEAVDAARRRPDLSVAEMIDTGDAFGFAVDPGQPELVSLLDRILGDLLSDGTYEEIYLQWFSAPAGSVLFGQSGGEPEPEVGSTALPIRLVFAPPASGDDPRPGAESIAGVLADWTGRAYEVVAAPSHAEAVRDICADPARSVGFLGSADALIAADTCDATVALMPTVGGSAIAWTAFIVPRDSDVEELPDLDGRSWARASSSPAATLMAAGVLAGFGVQPGEIVGAPDDAAVVRAVSAGATALGTIGYLPPVDAAGEVLWDGDPLHGGVPGELVDACAVDDTGRLACGEDYVVRDARSMAAAELPDVIRHVRILAVTEGFPHGAVVVGHGFPTTLREGISRALLETAADDADTFAAGLSAYGWTGLAEATFESFGPLRTALLGGGFGIADLG